MYWPVSMKQDQVWQWAGCDQRWSTSESLVAGLNLADSGHSSQSSVECQQQWTTIPRNTTITSRFKVKKWFSWICENILFYWVNFMESSKRNLIFVSREEKSSCQENYVAWLILKWSKLEFQFVVPLIILTSSPPRTSFSKLIKLFNKYFFRNTSSW